MRRSGSGEGVRRLKQEEENALDDPDSEACYSVPRATYVYLKSDYYKFKDMKPY